MAELAEELDPSTSSEPKDDQKTESSSVESETEEELLAVIENAINPQTETESQTEIEVKDGNQEEQTEEANSEESSEELISSEESSEEEAKLPPFHNHPRFKQVTKERKEALEKLELAQKDQSEYLKITKFLNDNKLSANEAAQGFQIMALMKSNPTEAIKALEPYVSQLQEVTGQVMPDDIREKVDQGYMDEDIGKDLSTTRAENNRLKQQLQSVDQQQQVVQKQQSFNSLANAVSDWEAKTAQNDPDYKTLENEVNDRVRVMVMEKGQPQTNEQAIDMVNQAYSEVKGRHGSRAKSPIKNTSGGKLGGTPMPEPKNLHDVIEMALGGSS